MKIKLIFAFMAFWLYTLLSAGQCLAKDPNIALSYTRLTVDEKGASYFIDESKEWNAWPSNLAMTTLTVHLRIMQNLTLTLHFCL